MAEEKITKPDAVIKLTAEQINQIAPLLEKRSATNSGLIFGSVGLNGKTLALSYLPHEIGIEIRDWRIKN